MAKPVCGAGDWLDSPGMPGPYSSDRRTASARDPVEVRRLLQRHADTLISGKGRSRTSECAAAEPGQGGGNATCGWTPSRIPPAGGVSDWTNKWKPQAIPTHRVAGVRGPS